MKLSEAISIDYTSKLVKKAALKCAFKYLQGFTWVFGTLLLTCIALAIFLGVVRPSAQNSYIFLSGYVLFVYGFIWFLVYARGWKSGKETIRKYAGIPLTLQFNEEDIVIHSALGKSELKWKAFDKVWCFSDLWLLFNSSLTYIIVPTEQLTPETKALIIRQLKENGAKIQ